MEQRDLFDRGDGGTDQYGNAMSRRDDPETSKIAAEKVDANKLQLVFVRRLSRLGRPSTANEIAVGGHGVVEESVRKRADECLRKGLVRVAGQRRCSVTGSMARTFELTGGGRNEADESAK